MNANLRGTATSRLAITRKYDSPISESHCIESCPVVSFTQVKLEHAEPAYTAKKGEVPASTDIARQFPVPTTRNQAVDMLTSNAEHIGLLASFKRVLPSTTEVDPKKGRLMFSAVTQLGRTRQGDA